MCIVHGTDANSVDCGMFHEGCGFKSRIIISFKYKPYCLTSQQQIYNKTQQICNKSKALQQNPQQIEQVELELHNY